MSTQRRLDEFSEGPVASSAPVLPSRPHPPALPEVWHVLGGKVTHPLLRPNEIRALPFQLDLARIGLSEDLLVVLPTGLGKTVIAALLAAELLRARDEKVLFLAPTRPLVQQHADTFGRW